MIQAEFDRLAALVFTRIPVLAEARAGRYSFMELACAERIAVRGRHVRRLLLDARGATPALRKPTRIRSTTYAHKMLQNFIEGVHP